VCFNALISNIDDHPRNHAVIAKEKDWKLSPAYDLTPSPMIAQERRDLAMDCGDQGRYANAENILSQHARFLLEKGEAEKIVTDMKGRWTQRGMTPCGLAVFRRKTPKRFVEPSSIRAFHCDSDIRKSRL